VKSVEKESAGIWGLELGTSRLEVQALASILLRRIIRLLDRMFLFSQDKNKHFLNFSRYICFIFIAPYKFQETVICMYINYQLF
jgi:hypothetical protein